MAQETETPLIDQKEENYFAKRAYHVSLLLKKNFILAKRNKRATILQLAVPIIFILLLYILEISLIQSDPGSTPVLDQPTEQVASKVTRCYKWNEKACLTLAVVPSNDTDVTALINIIKTRSGIPDDEIKYFDTSVDMDKYMLANKNTTLSGYVFANGTYKFPEKPTYQVVYNQTRTCRNSAECTDVTRDLLLPLQKAMDEAIITHVSGKEITLDIGFTSFPRPRITQDPVGGLITIFLFASSCFFMVIQLNMIVQEKEFKLREGLRIMGLKDSSFWVSWFIYVAITNLITVLLLSGAGAIFGLRFFLLNEFSTYFVLFFLFQMSMSLMAFALSTIMSRSSAATTLGFLVFFAGFILILVAGVLYNPDILKREEMEALSLLPMSVFGKGMADLNIPATSETGLKWSEISDHTDVFPLAEVYNWLMYDSLIFIFLTWYIDAVFPGEFGTPRHPLFFLSPAYWTDNHKKQEHVIDWEKSHLLPGEELDDDVTEALNFVKSGDAEKDPRTAIVIKNLVKRYRRYPMVDSENDYIAVRGVSFSIPQSSLMCVLGPNGAGKTTTINMLTGMFESSSGDATILGMSIRDDMDDIRKVIGVCPQHDILWDAMTGAEHIRMFASLKGVEDVEKEVQERLEEVGLSEVQNRLSGAYSGGMRRRLSVAIALTGNPRVVFLDEPTTGMDPVSRRQVWTIIERAKKNRTVILTTHSMEEAEVLADSITIMAKGVLQCIGNEIRLKSKFGTGYRLSVSILGEKMEGDGMEEEAKKGKELTGAEDAHERKERVTSFILENLPTAQELSTVDSHITILSYTLPRDLIPSLPEFFDKLEQQKEDLGILNFSISQTSMNSVFLNVAAKAEHFFNEASKKGLKPGGGLERKKSKKENSSSASSVSHFDTVTVEDAENDTTVVNKEVDHGSGVKE